MAVEVLRMEGITKISGNGFVANKNVTFWLNKGEILALVGENRKDHSDEGTVWS